VATRLDGSIVLDADSRIDWDPTEGASAGGAPAGADPNHHLWRNGRLWWIAFTVHRAHLQERVRFSFGTADLAEARRRRDRALALFAQARELKISLRFARRREQDCAEAVGVRS